MAEIFLMIVGAALTGCLAIAAVLYTVEHVWSWATNFKYMRKLHTNAYGIGFQEGYDAFRKDADLPPLPSARVPKKQKT